MKGVPLAHDDDVPAGPVVIKQLDSLSTETSFISETLAPPPFKRSS